MELEEEESLVQRGHRRLRKHAVNKFNRTVSMKTPIEEQEMERSDKDRERLKTVSQKRGGDETKSFRFHII